MKPIYLPLCLMLLASACGPDGPASFTESVRAFEPEGMLTCTTELTLPEPKPPIEMMERDRPHKTSRPRFTREWILVDGLSGSFIALFRGEEDARRFSDWLDREFVLDGVHFWDRPIFQRGHACQVWKVLGREEQPSAEIKQVMGRVERFPVAGKTSGELRAWFEPVKAEARNRGYVSVALLHSQETETAALVYFQDVPEDARNPHGAPPIAREPPLGSDGDLGWSGWTFSIWFPFKPGDEGREAIWPIPGLSP